MNWIRTRRAPRTAALLYHRVGDSGGDPFNIRVSTENFDSHMAALRRRDAVSVLSHHAAPGSVSVTFDDGYLDVFHNALPILEKYEIPATVFVTTGNLGGAFWWDRLSKLPEFHRAEYETFRSLPAEEREKRIQELENAGSSCENPRSRAMTAEELRQFAAHPLITIGAHTVSHARLSALSREEQCREIRESKETLEHILDRPVTEFSYPFGLTGRDFDDTTIEAAQDAGFKSAWAADTGVVTEKSPPFALPRLWVHNISDRLFESRLNRWLTL